MNSSNEITERKISASQEALHRARRRGAGQWKAVFMAVRFQMASPAIADIGDHDIISAERRAMAQQESPRPDVGYFGHC